MANTLRSDAADATDRRCADCEAPIGPHADICTECLLAEDAWAEDDENDDLRDVRCPECDGPMALLGDLGDRRHVRCRDCGAQGSWRVR